MDKEFIESLHGTVLRTSKTGSEFDAVLIEVGKSLNGINYTEDVLERAAPLFSNAKSFAYEFMGKVYDHLPQEVLETVPQGFAKNLVGHFDNVRFDEFTRPNGEKGKGIIGRFKVLASWLKDVLRNAGNNLPELLGFSIDAEGVIDRQTQRALSIDNVNSVDLVTHPAAGGGFLRMVASRVTESLKAEQIRETEEGNMHEKILEAIRSMLESLKDEVSDDALKAIFAEAYQEDEIEGAKDTLKDLVMRCSKYLAEDKAEFAEAYLTGYMEAHDMAKKTHDMAKKMDMASQKEPEVKPVMDKEEPSEEMKTSQEAMKVEAPPVVIPPVDEEARRELEAMRKEFKEMKLQKHLNESLQKSGLSEISKSFILNRTYESEEEMDKAIAQMKDYEAAFMKESGVSTKPAAEAGEDQGDKLVKMLDDVLEGTASIKEAYTLWTGDKKVTGLLRECYGQGTKRITESLGVSDWPQALGDSIRRFMLKEYAVDELQNWRNIVSDIVPVPDFRTQRWVRIGGYGTLPTVAERGTYTELTSPTDEEATMAISKKGGLESVTLEMIKNDDLLALKAIPRKLGRAAAQTLHRAIFNDILRDNPTTTYDSLALFVGGHNNLGSSALSHSTFLAARKAMAQQTAYGDSVEYLNLYPRWLIVPNDLEDVAFKLCHSPVYVNTVPYYSGGSAAEAATTPNIIPQRYRTEYMTVPYWTDTNDWVVIGDPKACPTIIVGFLDGKQEPELFIQDNPTVGSLFTADKIVYKIKHAWATMVADHRAMYKAVV